MRPHSRKWNSLYEEVGRSCETHQPNSDNLHVTNYPPSLLSPSLLHPLPPSLPPSSLSPSLLLSSLPPSLPPSPGDSLLSVATGALSEAQTERAGLVPTHAYAVLNVIEIKVRGALASKVKGHTINLGGWSFLCYTTYTVLPL